MAIVYPNVENQETLIRFATHILGCSDDDIRLLETACASLIEDNQVISNFILMRSDSLASNTPGSRVKSDAAYPPINYYRGSIPPFPMQDSNTSSAALCDLFYNSEKLFRPNEALLRSLLLRLRQGRTTMVNLNEKYDYAFTVITFGKEKSREVVLKGETVKPGVNLNLPTISSIGTAMGGCSNNTTTTTNDNRGGNQGYVEHGNNGRRVYASFMMFLMTFDALISWVSSVVGILSGEGAVPLSGTHVVYDQSEEKKGERVKEENESKEKNGEGKHTADTSGIVLLPEASDISPMREPLHEDAKNFPLTTASFATVHKEYSTQRKISRTIRVTRYELHDVSNIFHLFQNQASLFFLFEYTSYDPRVHRRLLLPAYYQSLREIIRDLNLEIERLEELGASLAKKQSNGAVIVFRPTVCEFRYILETLRLYWSLCVTEDDITAFQYYRMQYNRSVLEVGEVLEMLKELPRPPISANSATTNTTTTPSKNWAFTPEERGVIQVGFGSFWSIRESVLELHESLKKDIQDKNRTHRYRLPPSPPRPSHSLSGSLLTGRDSEKEFNFREWMLLTFSTLKQMVTCSAEFPDKRVSSMERDERGFPISTHSPLYESKKELLSLVRRLVMGVEAQATILERDYPGTFYRDTKALWAERANGIVRYLESMSTVFSRPE